MSTSIDTGARFFFEIIDPATRCIVDDMEVTDLEQFCSLHGWNISEIDRDACYDLDASEVAKIVDAFAIRHEKNAAEGSLRPARRIDQLPYKVHTGRELLLMLAGVKPLAVFSDTYPSALPPFEIIPEDVYAPHVDAGRLVRREIIVPPTVRDRNLATRIVCYALPREQWRIDAYLLLRRIGFEFGWSETCERMEGTLLGYSDEQNDRYIELIYRRR